MSDKSKTSIRFSATWPAALLFCVVSVALGQPPTDPALSEPGAVETPAPRPSPSDAEPPDLPPDAAQDDAPQDPVPAHGGPQAADQPGPSSPNPTPAPDQPPASPEDPDGGLGAEEAELDAPAADQAEQSEERLPFDDLRVFAEVFGRIKSDYVEKVNDRDLLASAIRGMLGGLDPHSTYLDADEYRDLQVGTTGEFGGLGIEVGMEDGFVKVIAPIDETPAQRAGMQAGDLIVRIDEKPVKGLSLDEAVKLMRGKPGTKIVLTVVRDDEAKPVRIEIERDVIHVASVKQRTLEPGYGYVRITHFQSRTTDDVLKAIETLKAENKDGINGLVLDLRNNPGGILNSAVGVSDAFLTSGLIVYTKGRVDDSRLEFKAGPEDVLNGAPIVVLVNGGSASASEIVAGALQDQRRALIMGSDTFGKGSVQTIVPIDERTALKLTTARYYTPSGRSIQAQGIVPDIELERGNLELVEDADVAPLKEADLVRHLEEAGIASPAEDDSDALPLAAEDFQLSEALNVLKGLHILTRAAPAPVPEAESRSAHLEQ